MLFFFALDVLVVIWILKGILILLVMLMDVEFVKIYFAEPFISG